MKKVLIPTKLNSVAREILSATGRYQVVQEDSENLEKLAKKTLTHTRLSYVAILLQRGLSIHCLS